jgi:RNA polymerase sigma-70 factor (ECF subfamily)
MSADSVDAVVVARPRVAAAERPSPDDALARIEQVYVQHAARFRRVARAIVGDLETSEDVVQEAFATAIRKRRSFRGSGDVVAWIWRIVVNTAVSRTRRRRLELRGLQRTQTSTGVGQQSGDERVREHVARLPERQRLVLFLHYYADLEYEAIGAALSIAPGTVGKLLHDARATMRRALEEERA